MKFDLVQEETSIIKVIGVGGGGSNAVNHMFKQGIVGVDFAICNTDAQAMELSPVPHRIQLGPALTEGRGAGSKPNIGKQACLESIDQIQAFLEDNTKMVFITAGMGGGTGTGAAPIIAKLARELDILTVGIVTLPFSFEGKRRESQAMEGLDEFKRQVDTLIVISNDKLRDIHGNLTLTEAFSHADNVLTTAAKGIAEIITVAGYINVDFEDVNTVMRDSGVAIMGTAVAEGADRARMAVDQALNSPLLEDNDIRGAQHILLNIASGQEEVRMDEIVEITDFVEAEAGAGTDVIWGNCYDEKLGNKLAVTIIATGFNHRKGISVGQDVNPEKIVVALEDDDAGKPDRGEPKSVDKTLFDVGYEDGDQPRTIEFDAPAARPSQRGQKKSAEELSPVNQTQRVGPQRSSNKAQLDWVEATSSNLGNPALLKEMERLPAYQRKNVSLDEIPHSSDQNMSKFSLSGGDQPEIRSTNSFLHDHVD